MKTFEFSIEGRLHQVIEWGTVLIEAENEQEARHQAEKMIVSGAISWDYQEPYPSDDTYTGSSHAVVAVKEVKDSDRGVLG